MTVSAFDLPDGPLGGSLSDGDEARTALPAEAGLLLIADNLVEARVQAIRENLFILIYQWAIVT